MNEAQLLRDYEREALYQHQGAAEMPTLPSRNPIDWNLVFITVARFMNAVAMGFVTFQFGRYFQYFGLEAIAFIGQYLIGCFFLYAVLTSEDGVKLLSGSFGMYLLLNSF